MGQWAHIKGQRTRKQDARLILSANRIPAVTFHLKCRDKKYNLL